MSRDFSHPVSLNVILSISRCPADERARHNGVADAPPHMGYHAELGRSALKDVEKIQENPKIGERLNSAHLVLEAWLTPRYTPIPHIVLTLQI